MNHGIYSIPKKKGIPQDTLFGKYLKSFITKLSSVDLTVITYFKL